MFSACFSTVRQLMKSPSAISGMESLSESRNAISRSRRVNPRRGAYLQEEIVDPGPGKGRHIRHCQASGPRIHAVTFSESLQDPESAVNVQKYVPSPHEEAHETIHNHVMENVTE